MCDLICDIISCSVCEAATWVKSLYMTKSLLKTEKIWKSKTFSHKSPSN